MSTRHKWQQIGHVFNHKKRCIVCGCIKDNSVVNKTIYTLNNNSYFTAPICTTPAIEQMCDESEHATKQIERNQNF